MLSKIVAGAVDIVQAALDRIDKQGVVSMDDSRKADVVANLLVVLCSDTPATPMINTGSRQLHWFRQDNWQSCQFFVRIIGKTATDSYEKVADGYIYLPMCLEESYPVMHLGQLGGIQLRWVEIHVFDEVMNQFPRLSIRHVPVE